MLVEEEEEEEEEEVGGGHTRGFGVRLLGRALRRPIQGGAAIVCCMR